MFLSEKSKQKKVHKLLLLKQYLNGKLDSLFSPDVEHYIKSNSVNFTVDNDKLYYKGKMGNKKCLVLFKEEDKLKAFNECHNLSSSNFHKGRTRTLKALTELYYWINMTEDVIKLIANCETCQTISPSNHFVVNVTESWEIVSLDILGQFTVSLHGNVFVAVMTDMFTKYTVAVPMRDTTSNDVFQAILGVVLSLGSPKKFVSDQNLHFVVQVINRLMNNVAFFSIYKFLKLNEYLDLNLGTDDLVISVPTSQINRPHECDIKLDILKHCLNTGAKWDDMLKKKVYEINTKHLAVIGRSPFYLMFHRDPHSLNEYHDIGVDLGVTPKFILRDFAYYIEKSEKLTSQLQQQVAHGESDIHTRASDFKQYNMSEDASTSVERYKQLKYDGQSIFSGDSIHLVPNEDLPLFDSSNELLTHIPTNREALSALHTGVSSIYPMEDGEGPVAVVTDSLLKDILECGDEDVGGFATNLPPVFDSLSDISTSNEKKETAKF